MAEQNNWFPTRNRMVMEILATTIGVIGASMLISQFPSLKALVDANSVWALDNPNSGTVTVQSGSASTTST